MSKVAVCVRTTCIAQKDGVWHFDMQCHHCNGVTCDVLLELEGEHKLAVRRLSVSEHACLEADLACWKTLLGHACSVCQLQTWLDIGLYTGEPQS